MAVENTARSLGAGASNIIARRLSNLPALQSVVRPVRTDNRLHAWEWLVTAEGILKVDAVDHCEGHDLIGCQDIAWDVAGGIAEHDLTVAETVSLCNVIEAHSVTIDAQLLNALLPCYLAFQLGLWSTASGSAAEAVADGYARKLSRCLG